MQPFSMSVADDVINQALAYVFAKDKEFQQISRFESQCAGNIAGEKACFSACR